MLFVYNTKDDHDYDDDNTSKVAVMMTVQCSEFGIKDNFLVLTAEKLILVKQIPNDSKSF